MPLTDTAIRNAKPGPKNQKLFDGGGLFLLVSPKGGKWWRLKYRIDGKEKLLSLGTYPEVGLKSARDKRAEARKLIAEGIDPSKHRQAGKHAKATEQANSFEGIAREWHQRQSPTWSVSYAKKVLSRLEKDLFPLLAKEPISSISAPQLLKPLRFIEERGSIETAHRLHQISGQIFRYAIATGRAQYNPAPDLRGALKKAETTHLAAITSPAEVGSLLRSIDSYQGHLVTKFALKLAPLVFVRPGELRNAEWAEIDFDKSEWNIPAHKMKMKEAHLVPLSKQALDIIRELKKYTDDSPYLFPSPRSRKRPISGNAVLSALRRMGYTKEQMTGHGFRAMARTILDEELHIRPDYIEHQLAHAVRDPNGRAYNRTAHLAERKKMMQIWADYLDALKAGKKSNNIIKLAGI